MKRKKKSPDFESIRREIERRLKAGLPLAGMIAATTLLCSCQERAGRVTEGLVERDPSLCEQQNEQPQPKPQTPEEQFREIEKRINDHLNDPNNINESTEARPDGMIPRIDQEQLERRKEAIKEQADKSNKTNETVDPASTRGRYPSMKKDK